MTASRPRIVVIGEHNPYGQIYGGGLRTRVAIEALSLVGDVTLVPLTRYPWSELATVEAAKRFALTRRVPFHAREREGLAPRLRRNLRPRSMDTDGFYVKENDLKFVEDLVATAHLVWLRNVVLANVLRRWRWPRTVLELDDLQSQYLMTEAAVSSGPRRIRALWRAAVWGQREKLLGERFDHVVVCSEQDKRHLRIKVRVHVIPNTFDDADVAVLRRPVTPPRFGFIGTCRWEPNRDAVEWFGGRVWPLIERALPGSEFRIIGRDSAQLVRDRRLPGVGLDYVEDPTPEMGTWTAMVVPVRIGGGTRIKIAEAFVRQIPVVATTLGAFGYEVTNGRELLLADDADRFAEACIRIVRESDLAERLTLQAGDLYRSKYSALSVRRRVVDVAMEVLSSATPGGSLATNLRK